MFLFGVKFKVPSPEIVKDTPEFKYIIPSLELEEESVKDDVPVNFIVTVFPELIIIGVNELDEVSDKEFKVNVASDEITKFLLVPVPVKIYVPSDDIVTVEPLMEYPAPSDKVEEKSIVVSDLINKTIMNIKNIVLYIIML